MSFDTDRLLCRYCLGLADDAAILSLRLAEWIGRAPGLDEEISLTNMALDLLGQSRALYRYAAELEGEGRHEDELAYLRSEPDYFNVLLVEQPNRDFASMMARHFLFSAVQHSFWRATRGSSDAVLAQFAGGTARQFEYHLRLTGGWLIRRGGDRCDEADVFAPLWPYLEELLECDARCEALVLRGAVVDPGTIRAEVDAQLDEVLERIHVTRPSGGLVRTGGRQGRHSEHLGPLLTRMQPMLETLHRFQWDRSGR